MGKSRINRTASEKIEIIQESYKTGDIAGTAARHGIAPDMLSKWRGQLWEGADVVFDPKIRDKSKNKIKELESLIGRQTIAIDFLKRAEQYVA